LEQVSTMEDRVRNFFNTRFADAVIREDNFRDQQSFYIKPEYLIEICEALLDDIELDIKYLSDITSSDWLGHKNADNGRFEIVYNLYSLSSHYRFFLKIYLPEDNPSIASLANLWLGANWMEREVYDMMGITFDGHPNLIRILTPDDFEGYPLRKDYPLTYEEPQFNWNKDNPPEIIK